MALLIALIAAPPGPARGGVITTAYWWRVRAPGAAGRLAVSRGGRRAGHRADARGPLAEALELAARCGARPLAARPREELNAAGARPSSVWRTGWKR